jgi:hypothetical protein
VSDRLEREKASIPAARANLAVFSGKANRFLVLLLLRSHRLVAQDAGLSRRKQGFETPWDYFFFFSETSRSLFFINRKASYVLPPRVIPLPGPCDVSFFRTMSYRARWSIALQDNLPFTRPPILSFFVIIFC